MESLMFNQASDVWSFGVVLIELAQDGDRPYHNLRSNGDVMALTMSGKRHRKPEGCSNTLFTLILRCWAAEPKNRPSFTDLVAELQCIFTKITVWGEELTPTSDGNSNEIAAASARRTFSVEQHNAQGARDVSREGDDIVQSEPKLFGEADSSQEKSTARTVDVVEYEPLVRSLAGSIDGGVESVARYSQQSAAAGVYRTLTLTDDHADVQLRTLSAV
jgi:serine/threonine protein kinase